jgi:hypothetical protein
LVIAGANHHTKPGYWESIRESQAGNSRIDFRGYVAEEAIPELYATTSVVVMPYDSATGSSGPAHQACEYGVPIVCADIADFRSMADDEDMTVDFYKARDAADLADKLVAILQSPSRQRAAAEHNFSAAMRMTMPSVVRQYLRWFELARHKQTKSGLIRFRLRSSRGPFSSRAVDSQVSRRSSSTSWNWTLQESSAPESAATDQDQVGGIPIHREDDQKGA